MLLNQASNKTHTQVSREREREYCPSHCHTKFDRHLKHIYNKKKKKKEEKLIFGNGIELLHFSVTLHFLIQLSTLGGRHQSKHSLTAEKP